jgi:[FeFe] hydrogenase H-cluster maturation GTPase HydF
MELLPFGPVVFVDTAGLDDEGGLGELRVKKTREAERSADLLVYVSAGMLSAAERAYILENRARLLLVCTHADRRSGPSEDRAELTSAGVFCLELSNLSELGVPELKDEIIRRLEKLRERERTLLQSMVSRYSLIMLIVPIDLEAPKGRLILPQVQTIREVLDADSGCIVVKEREVDWMLAQLKRRPDLAITDSQVVLKAAGSLAEDIPLTTFSVLFSRLKGDLSVFVEGVKQIDRLVDGDRVLIAESCAHHAHSDDIGRVKIPRWLRQYTGKDLDISVVGGGYPDDVAEYSLIIHCGACMINRRSMLSRVEEAKDLGIPITNYGVAISHLHGLLDRVLVPFSGELV